MWFISFRGSSLLHQNREQIKGEMKEKALAEEYVLFCLKKLFKIFVLLLYRLCAQPGVSRVKYDSATTVQQPALYG